MIHLDTNTVIAFLNGDQGVASKLRAAIPDVAISALVLAELCYGAAKSTRRDENFNRISQLTEIVGVAPFDASCATAYGKLKLELRQQGTPTGEVDALIAVTCIACNATLVTHNTRHFDNMTGLRLDDWLT